MFFLEGKRIGLRDLRDSDVDGNYASWLNDKEVCEFNSHHRFYCTRKQLYEYVEAVNSSKDVIVFAIIEKEKNIHIGNISLQQIDYINRNAEIAFLLGDKDYWGKGYASEAARLLIEHALYQLGLERIYFGTSVENVRMQSLGERLGFKKEGIRRQALFKNNHFCDILEYGLLKKEWKSV